jgi:hypothetical protein
VAPVAGAAAPLTVNFSFLVVQRFKAYCYWALLRKCQGTALYAIDADKFTEDMWVLTTMQRIQELAQIKTALEDQVPTKPTKLWWDLLLWPKFWEKLKTYLLQCRRAVNLHWRRRNLSLRKQMTGAERVEMPATNSDAIPICPRSQPSIRKMILVRSDKLGMSLAG